MSTPGHGGRVCENQAFWEAHVSYSITAHSNKLQFFFMFTWPSGVSVQTLVPCCPACGIRLQPDPEPLPKCPDGHTPECGSLYDAPTDNSVFCRRSTYITHYWAENEAAWRRAFGSKP
jgi:hypothetical protein